MLSVVVVVMNSAEVPLPAEAIVRTLSSLVPAAVEGLVRDVTLAAPAGSAGVRRIADHAGCVLAEAGDGVNVFRHGMKACRNPDVFVLRAGRAPEAAFGEEVTDLLTGGRRAALMREAARGLATRLLPVLSPVAGIICRRDRLADTRATTFGELARQARPAITLRSRARFVE